MSRRASPTKTNVLICKKKVRDERTASMTLGTLSLIMVIIATGLVGYIVSLANGNLNQIEKAAIAMISVSLFLNIIAFSHVGVGFVLLLSLIAATALIFVYAQQYSTAFSYPYLIAAGALTALSTLFILVVVSIGFKHHRMGIKASTTLKTRSGSKTRWLEL